MTMDALSLVAEYQALGYDAIPLAPNDKRAFCEGWPRLAPSVQWSAAPSDANIGFRGGGDARAVYCDCDDKAAAGTSANVKRLLAGLGYYPDGDYPTVLTVHGGTHVYARSTVRLEGHYRNLRRELGAGELRYGPGSLVVAPGSTVNGFTYTLARGDLRQLPALDLADLRQLADVEASTATGLAKMPTMPRSARALLHGERIDRYLSRSEAEQACIASLVAAGFDFAAVFTLFLENPCAGKFQELRRKSEHRAHEWLRHSYSAAVKWTDTHESAGRRVAREAQTWAAARPWPGATGNSDAAVFLAHCEIARQAGAVTYAASVRRLAELAGVGMMTAQRANRRLLEAGHVVYDRAHAGTYSNLYRLGGVQDEYTSTHPHRVEVYSSCTSADAFRFRGLGKSAALVLSHLARQPMTEAELEAATGKHRTTVARALAKMERIIDPTTGEVLTLVERDGEAWRAVPGVDLDAVARAVGTDGAGERQKQQHAEERRGFRRAIARAKAGTTPAREGARDD